MVLEDRKGTERMTDTSYRGYVTACRGNVLLGGVRHHESSRFETREMASAWIQTVLEANCEAHRAVSATGWERLDKAPEILASGVLS